MAYTYENFVSNANAAGLMNQFSEQDLQIAQRNPEFGLSLLGLLKDNSNAKTAEQRLLATEAANQLRKNYGVYNTGSLGTDSAYAGSYGTQINDLMGQIKNYGSFDYANQDPSTMRVRITTRRCWTASYTSSPSATIFSLIPAGAPIRRRTCGRATVPAPTPWLKRPLPAAAGRPAMP